MADDYGWDQSTFNRTLERYMQVTPRTLQQVINTKLYFISLKALWNTLKADAYKMKQELGGFVSVRVVGRKGKMVNRKQVVLRAGRQGAPLAALILQARQGKEDKKGLYGSAMAKAIRKFLASRARSIGFIKSGFLTAIKEFFPLAVRKGAPPRDSSVKQYGRPKGDAKPAPPGFNIRGQFANLAGSARNDKNGALARYGGEGLAIAFGEEESSMNQFIEERMKPDADQFNQQQK